MTALSRSRLLTTREMAGLLRMHVPDLLKLANTPGGGLRPAVCGGHGNGGHRWSMLQAFVVILGRGLRRRRLPKDAVEEILKTLWALGLEQFEAELEAGRKYIVAFGDRVFQRLVTAEKLTDERLLTFAAEIDSTAVGVVSVDVALLWQNFLVLAQDRLSELAAARQEAHQ